MNVDTEPTPPAPTPSPSRLFSDITADDYAGWVKQAEALSTPAMTCDADDVILAAHLLSFGEHVLKTGDASLRTSAMRKLYSQTPVGLRSLVCLAKLLRRTCPDATGEDLVRAGLDLTTTLTTVLVAVAPDVKRPKHPKG